MSAAADIQKNIDEEKEKEVQEEYSLLDYSDIQSSGEITSLPETNTGINEWIEETVVVQPLPHVANQIENNNNFRKFFRFRFPVLQLIIQSEFTILITKKCKVFILCILPTDNTVKLL